MINVDDLKEIIKLVLYSGYIIGEQPLSIFLISKVGNGKSAILNTFKLNDNIGYFTDLTYMGLIQILKDNKELRHIVIPDFLKITMKKSSTRDNILSCINCGIEEGLDTINIMGQKHEFDGRKFGLITATTKDSYERRFQEWESMGFISRCLMITFDYKDKTIDEIFEYITKRLYLNKSNHQLEMPVKNFNVKLPYKLAKKLQKINLNRSFRFQKQLQTLAMANTLIDNRKVLKVTNKDIDKIIKLSKYFNKDYNKI